MILSHRELKREIDARHIVFDPPLEERQWGEASIDLRLGRKVTKFKPADGMTFSVAGGLGAIADSGLWTEKTLEEDDGLGQPGQLVLKPNEFALALTHERITVPRNLIALVEGRSTYARVGLTMHQTAPWIQPGWSGQITLEIRNSGLWSIALTPLIDMPCQLTFLQLTSPVPKGKAYGGKTKDVYQNQTSAMPKKKSK